MKLAGRNQAIALNNSLFIPLYGNYHHRASAFTPSTQQGLEGAPQLAERCPVLELTSLPWAFSLLPSLYGPGSAGSLFCPAPGPASVFFSMKSWARRIFPFFFGKLGIITISELEENSERALCLVPLLLETRILRGREVKGLGHVAWVIYDNVRTSIQPAISLSQLKGAKHQINGCSRFCGGHFCLALFVCWIISFILQFSSGISLAHLYPVAQAKCTRLSSSMGSKHITGGRPITEMNSHPSQTEIWEALEQLPREGHMCISLIPIGFPWHLGPPAWELFRAILLSHEAKKRSQSPEGEGESVLMTLSF